MGTDDACVFLDALGGAGGMTKPDCLEVCGGLCAGIRESLAGTEVALLIFMCAVVF